MSGRALVAAVAAAVLLAGAASAQMHPLTNIPEPLEGVLTSVWFPKHTGAQFEAGEVVEVIVGFRNTGPTPANVSFIVGSLNSAADFSMHFQNFSALRPAGPVVQLAPNGGDAAVSYRFQLAPNLPEYAFQVALTAFLDVDGETIGEGSNKITIPKMNAHTFFNRTVDVVEPTRLVDWQLLQMVVTLLAFGGAVGWVGVQMAKAGGSGEGGDFSKKKMGSGSSTGGKKASTAASVSASSASSKPAAASDWLKGTNIGGSGKSKKKA